MPRILWLLAYPLLAAGAQPPGATRTPPNYSEWIEPYQRGPLHAVLGGGLSESKLVITEVVTEDLKVPSPKPGEPIPRFPQGALLRQGCTVSTTGQVARLLLTVGSAKASGYRQLSPSALTRLMKLMEVLPGDASTLPPQGRRLVLQVASSGGIIARVYDSAHAPEQVLEILRLTGCSLTPVSSTNGSNHSADAGAPVEPAAPPPASRPKTPPAVFEVVLRAGQDTVKAGEKLTVTATLINRADHTITFGRDVYHSGCPVDVIDGGGAVAPDKKPGYSRGRFDLQRLMSTMSPEELAKSGLLNGKLAWISLKPGETFEEACEVTSYYDMTKPGVYQIAAHEYRDLQGAGTIQANRITVTVTK